MTPGTERWKDEEKALDRVWSVGVTLSRPRSAKWKAEEAEVSERTTRRYLAKLVEIGMLEELSGESSVLFRPDPLYVRLRAMRDLLEEHEDLEGLRSTLEEQIETLRKPYRTESPEALRKRATDTSDHTREIRWAANDLETILYRLGLVEEALELRASGVV